MRLYIHWPFCISRCAYCDFNSRVAEEHIMRSYGQALVSELEAWARIMSEEERDLDSVYLGGGTPSLLSGGEVAALLGEVASRFRMHGETEVTVEVNPATWTRDDFEGAIAGGVNRVSIGVQSLADRDLLLLGRAHDASAARRAAAYALDCDGVSVSLDIIYGVPGMSVASLVSCLHEVLLMGPQHLSLYALTLEERTPLYKAAASGDIDLPEEDEVAEQYLAAAGLLREHGYEHYEIANFCMPGHHSRHNLAYWKREQYLGIGAGAHSLRGRCRFRNTDSVLAYVRMLAGGQLAVAGCETLDADEELAEEIMLGLRTSSGVCDAILSVEDAYVEALAREGILIREDGRIRLTDAGMMVCNALILELLPA